jgi:hypothetical protein
MPFASQIDAGNIRPDNRQSTQLFLHLPLAFPNRSPGLARSRILAWGSAMTASPMFNCPPGTMLKKGHRLQCL